MHEAVELSKTNVHIKACENQNVTVTDSGIYVSNMNVWLVLKQCREGVNILEGGG